MIVPRQKSVQISLRTRNPPIYKLKHNKNFKSKQLER